MEPTYKITITVQRSDEPGGKFKAIFSEIPREAAEDPSYVHYSAVECFRRYVAAETRPDPREG